MSRLVYFCSWIAAYYPVYIVLSAISGGFLILLTPKISFWVYFLMYAIYGLLLCVQANFVGIFFSRPKIAISVASLFYVIQYLIVLLVRDKP